MTMDNSQQFYSELGDIAWSAFLIEKVHRCDECPIRKMAIEQPRSVFARLHTWHKNWWPGWKAHQARACAHAANANSQAQNNSLGSVRSAN